MSNIFKNILNNKRSHIINTIFIIFVFCAIIVSCAFSCVTIYNNFILSDQYAKSNRVVITLDVSHTSSDPTAPVANESQQEIEKNIQKSASALSAYLENEKITTFNTVKSIGYNAEKKEGYLEVYLPSEWSFPDTNNGKRTSTDPKKERLPSVSTYFNIINSNRISLVFDANTSRVFTPSTSSSTWDKGYLASIDIQNLYEHSENVNKKEKSNSVVITTPTSTSDTKITSSEWKEFLKNNLKDTVSTDSSSDTSASTASALSPVLMDDPVEPTPEIYIIRDQETLIMRMRYILQVYTSYRLPTQKNSAEYSEAYKYLTASEYQWASEILGDSNLFTEDKLFAGAPLYRTHVSPKTMIATNVNSITSTFPLGDSTENTWYGDDYVKFNNNYFTRLIESKPGYNSATVSDRTLLFPNGFNTSSDSENTSSDTIGTVKYDWMKPYVLGIIHANNDTLDNFFPTANPLDSTAKADPENRGRWIKFDASGQYERNKWYSYITQKYSTVYPIKLFNNGVGRGINDNNKGGLIEQFKATNNKQYSDDVANEEIKSLDEYWGVNASFTSGLFGLIPSSIIASLIAIGVFIILACAVLTFIYRIPGLFASLLLILLNILSLLIFTLTSHLVSFAVILSLFVCSIIYVIATISILERIHKNAVLSNATADSSIKKAFKAGTWTVVDIFLVTIIMAISAVYFGPLAIYEFGLLTLLFQMLAIGIFIVWSFITYIFFSNHVFRNKKRLLFFSKKISNIDPANAEHELGQEHKYETSFTLKKVEDVNSKFYFKRKTEWILFFVLAGLGLASLITLLVLDRTYVFSVSGINNAISSAIICLGIMIGFLSIYALIKLNWTTVVSILVSNIAFIATAMLMLYFVSIFNFNEAIVCVFSIVLIVNVLLFTFINNINNRWIKYQTFNLPELKVVINEEIVSDFAYFYKWIGLGLLISFVLFTIISSTFIILPLILTIAFLALSILIAYAIVKFTLARFIYWRLTYRRILVEKEFFINTSLDKIDEQTIPGLNHFKLLKIEL